LLVAGPVSSFALDQRDDGAEVVRPLHATRETANVRSGWSAGARTKRAANRMLASEHGVNVIAWSTACWRSLLADGCHWPPNPQVASGAAFLVVLCHWDYGGELRAVVAWVAGGSLPAAARGARTAAADAGGRGDHRGDQWRFPETAFVWPVLACKVATVSGPGNDRGQSLGSLCGRSTACWRAASLANRFLHQCVVWLGLWFGLTAHADYRAFLCHRSGTRVPCWPVWWF